MHADIDPSTIRPLKRLEFEALAEQGHFDQERVELIHGVVVRMSPIGPAHNDAVEALTKILVLAVMDRARVRPACSFPVSDDSEPVPDFSVLDPDNRSDDPLTAFLIIEVSDKSLRHDQKVKVPLYAAAGVPEYWIVNIVKRAIEVYRKPVKGQYAVKTIHARGDTVTMLKFPDVTIRVSDDIR